MGKNNDNVNENENENGNENGNENENGNGLRRAARRLQPMTSWDATKTYKQMVVLFEFTDSAFHREDVRAAYDKIFNQTGYTRDRAQAVWPTTSATSLAGC